MPPAMPMPIKPAIAPLGLAAAARIASLWALAILAAAIVGSRMTAAFCRSLIICSSSCEAAIELTPKLTISTPRRSRQSAERTSMSARASAVVWPGMAL